MRPANLGENTSEVRFDLALEDAHIIYPAVQNAVISLERLGMEPALVNDGGFITSIFTGADTGDRAGMFHVRNHMTREALETNYDKVLTDSHKTYNVTRFLWQRPNLQQSQL